MIKRSFFGTIFHALLSPFMVSGGTEMVSVARTVHAPDGKHRVRFFRREEDGICGYREEYFDDKMLEMAWLPLDKEHAEEYSDMDSAVAAAKAKVPWLHLVMH
jgi:hypothetical protein